MHEYGMGNKTTKQGSKQFLPKAFTGETGVWKKMTELTMTTTRFTQLPTEWVTGDTLCNIIYETCSHSQKPSVNY